MIHRYREWEAEKMDSKERKERQLIFALTANGNEIAQESEFDGVHSKPFSLLQISELIQDIFVD
jgi:hypothetical protein